MMTPPSDLPTMYSPFNVALDPGPWTLDPINPEPWTLDPAPWTVNSAP